MHEVFNMGCGFCVIVPEADVEAAVGTLSGRPTGRRGGIGSVAEPAGDWLTVRLRARTQLGRSRWSNRDEVRPYLADGISLPELEGVAKRALSPDTQEPESHRSPSTTCTHCPAH